MINHIIFIFSLTYILWLYSDKPNKQRLPANLKDSLLELTFNYDKQTLKKWLSCEDAIKALRTHSIWDRVDLKQFANQPRFHNTENPDSPFYNSDISYLNESLPKLRTSYFNSEYKIEKSVETWNMSSLIKVPKNKYSLAPFIDITASELNPESQFHYDNPNIDMRIDSFTNENIYFLSFKNPNNFPTYREKLIFSDILQSQKALEGERSAIFFQTDDELFTVLHLNKLQSLDNNHPYYESLIGLKDMFLDFFISIYNARFELMPEFISMLKDVSEELKDRTITILKLKNPIETIGQEVIFPKDQSILGSFSFVISNSEKELLPYELTNKMLKERKLGTQVHRPLKTKRDPTKTYAEFTRLSVDKENTSTKSTADIIKIAAAAAKGYQIDEMIIYVDPFHKKLFKKFGFSELEKYKDSFGETFYIMSSPPEVVLHHVMEVYNQLEFKQDELLEGLKNQFK